MGVVVYWPVQIVLASFVLGLVWYRVVAFTSVFVRFCSDSLSLVCLRCVVSDLLSSVLLRVRCCSACVVLRVKRLCLAVPYSRFV